MAAGREEERAGRGRGEEGAGRRARGEAPERGRGIGWETAGCGETPRPISLACGIYITPEEEALQKARVRAYALENFNARRSPSQSAPPLNLEIRMRERRG